MDEKPVLTVNVVTPDGSVYENTTDLVICTTTVGQVGIMLLGQEELDSAGT